MSELFDKQQAVAQEHIELTREYLEHPGVALHLGELAVSRMVELADRMYVPVVVDGVIVPEDGGVPVVSLRPGEVITYDSGLSSEQAQAVVDLSRGRFTDTASLNETLSSKTVKLPSQAVGTTLTQKADLSVGPAGYELRGSPAIVLNNQRVGKKGYYSTALLHELVHAGQALKRPVRKKSDHGFMKEEAQAYNVQSKVLAGLGIEGGDNAHKVSQAYELWKQQGLLLDSEDDVKAFNDILRHLGVPMIHPKQRKIK